MVKEEEEEDGRDERKTARWALLDGYKKMKGIEVESLFMKREQKI